MSFAQAASGPCRVRDIIPLGQCHFLPGQAGLRKTKPAPALPVQSTGFEDLASKVASYHPNQMCLLVFAIPIIQGTQLNPDNKTPLKPVQN